MKHGASNRINYIFRNGTRFDSKKGISKEVVRYFSELLMADNVLIPEAQECVLLMLSLRF